jgi:alpha-glucosidase (family GH31 glycosyl hydrolase)
MVYLPAGSWRDFWTGTAKRGGQSIEVTATHKQPPVFVRDNTLLPLAEPMLTFNVRRPLRIHLAAYGSNPVPCQLREDDGTSFAYEKGKWATVTVYPDGKIVRPQNGQPRRYRIVAPARAASAVLNDLLTKGA